MVATRRGARYVSWCLPSVLPGAIRPLPSPPTQTAVCAWWTPVPRVLIVGSNPVCTVAVATAVMGYNPRANHTLLVGPYDEGVMRRGPSPVLQGYTVDPVALVDLRRVLTRLSPDDRALIALRYGLGFDAAEIGAATGRSAGATRTRICSPEIRCCWPTHALARTRRWNR